MKQSSNISDMVQNNWNNISATQNLCTVNSIFPSTDLSGMPPALRYHWSFVKVSYKAACSLYYSVNQITRMDLCSLKTKPSISNTPSAQNWYIRYLQQIAIVRKCVFQIYCSGFSLKTLRICTNTLRKNYIQCTINHNLSRNHQNIAPKIRCVVVK